MIIIRGIFLIMIVVGPVFSVDCIDDGTGGRILSSTSAYIKNIGDCIFSLKMKILNVDFIFSGTDALKKNKEMLYVYLTRQNKNDRNLPCVIWNDVIPYEFLIGGKINRRVTGDLFIDDHGMVCNILVIQNNRFDVYRVKSEEKFPLISDQYPPKGWSHESWNDFMSSKAIYQMKSSVLSNIDNESCVREIFSFLNFDQLGGTGIFLPDESNGNAVTILIVGGHRDFMKVLTEQKNGKWMYRCEFIEKTKINDKIRQRIAEQVKNNTSFFVNDSDNHQTKKSGDEYIKSEIIKNFEDQKPDQIEAFVKNQSDEILKHFIQNSGPKHLSEAKLYFLLLTLSRSPSLEKQSPKLLFDFYDASIVLLKDDFQKNRPKPGSKDQALIIIDEGLRCDATTYINQIGALKMIRKCVRRMPKGPERDDLQKRVAENAKKLLDQWQNHFLVRHLEDLSIIRPDPEENPKPLENK